MRRLVDRLEVDDEGRLLSTILESVHCIGPSDKKSGRADDPAAA